MQNKIIKAIFTCLLFLSMSNQASAELILGYEQANGPAEGSKITPIEILLTGETSGTPITGLTKANFKFVIARDISTGEVRNIRWDVVALSVPGTYRLKIVPVGWEFVTGATNTDTSNGITALFRVTTSNGASSGGIALYIH